MDFLWQFFDFFLHLDVHLKWVIGTYHAWTYPYSSSSSSARRAWW